MTTKDVAEGMTCSMMMKRRAHRARQSLSQAIRVEVAKGVSARVGNKRGEMRRRISAVMSTMMVGVIDFVNVIAPSGR